MLDALPAFEGFDAAEASEWLDQSTVVDLIQAHAGEEPQHDADEKEERRNVLILGAGAGSDAGDEAGHGVLLRGGNGEGA